MRNINPPAAHPTSPQSALFDTDCYGWWHNRLSPNALARLEGSLEGILRRSILALLPATKIAAHFDPEIGRPTKEIYAMCGLLLLAEFRDLTVDQTADAWTYDASVQYALNLPRDGQYLSPRTVDTYRALLRKSEAARVQVTTCPQELRREL